MTEVLQGLGAAERRRIAGLREQGRFFWLDVALSETSRDTLVEALAMPERARRALSARGNGYLSRMFHADAEAVVFPVRCHIHPDAPAPEAAYGWRPVEVAVLITADYDAIRTTTLPRLWPPSTMRCASTMRSKGSTVWITGLSFPAAVSATSSE
jgi:hypothetical protein